MVVKEFKVGRYYRWTGEEIDGKWHPFQREHWKKRNPQKVTKIGLKANKFTVLTFNGTKEEKYPYSKKEFEEIETELQEIKKEVLE